MGATVLAKIFKFEKLKRFFTDDAWKAVGKLGWLVHFTENVVYFILILS